MYYTHLPALNTKISKVAFGSVKLGRNTEVKYPHPFTVPTDNEARSLLACVRDLGINVIDTAPAYGSAEEQLGKLLPNRDEWLLFSKVGETFRNGASSFNFSTSAIQQSLATSLRHLRTEYLDGLLLHSDGNDTQEAFSEKGEAVDALQMAKKSGKVRLIGISVKTSAGARRALAWADCVMLEYNLALDVSEQNAYQAVLAEAKRQNKIIFIKKALASGHAAASPGGVEAALRFVLDQPVSSIVLGSVSATHWQDNVQQLDAIVQSKQAHHARAHENGCSST